MKTNQAKTKYSPAFKSTLGNRLELLIQKKYPQKKSKFRFMGNIAYLSTIFMILFGLYVSPFTTNTIKYEREVEEAITEIDLILYEFDALNFEDIEILNI